ncbi:Thioredoxin reductase [Caldanaerobius fijiensis DSM 17918]|uniref:Thioredoxin reductase n=1 Tax=Caldanaerobius fijiensis DSM 17918 TaxID=1121256 RepID=A0A1M5AA88_9THEO|nr:FAD-dependent oxidoreductase [Caldanaerobius fijiensis]SHF26997.1 Thioredoxin reductase [Caldanaerobius fijiensis DSM 17918]
MLKYDVVIVGGGPAGLGAAIEACDAGSKVLILERDDELGGILRQCIHNGFGLHEFKEELTGPEYANRFIEQVKARDIDVKLNTMVLDITPERTVYAVNSKDGVMSIKAGSIVLAMGCRERTRGAIGIPGARPAGVYTAGTAQRFINIEGYMPGREVVILGSGDIGLIMARRLTLEGAIVKCVLEIMPYSTGLTRNIVQCLNDFDIPLLLNHTVIEVHGKKRVEGVTIARVDERRMPVHGTEKYISCDTLLLSVGLIPENELSKKASVVLDRVTGGAVVDEYMHTSIDGIFACGNVLQVHDLVDNVTKESRIAGKSAALYAQGKLRRAEEYIYTRAGNGIRYVVPQKITADGRDDITLNMRVTDIFENTYIVLKNDDKTVKRFKRDYLTPGEMQVLKVKRSDLEGIKGQLIVEVER